ncbi:MAG TPA: methyltransferase domain-containing protein [Ramlibacter sp.]|uniref:class I SAM-dependent methyltransferase n=1 Tax=Ramlibacter sp. TaxID=1917967 RepID=UPI002B573974|nr:methyltransferase domain-containing protein [Ramlibacter sp.]HVZ43961.1 methyltransferase domain-containing protein [Ramlibacter sp.]
MPQDAPARARLCAAKFVAHNIPLAPGLCTRPGEPLIGESPRTKAIHDALRLFVPGGAGGKTAVDLGCLEGGLTYELWRAGLRVVGVEAREDNLERCLLVRDWFDAAGAMEFVRSDVREFRPGAAFDVVLCSGLLYHLDDPAGYIGELGRLAAPGGLLYLDTHVAPEDADLPECNFRAALSPWKTRLHEGLAIRYREYAEDITKPESSVGNPVSLWMDIASHVELLQRAGFSRVFEMHGWFGAGEMDLKRRFARHYWACIKQA